MPFNPYPQSFGYPGAAPGQCQERDSQLMDDHCPQYMLASFPIHKGQLFIIANIYCIYIYIYIAMITIIILHSILLILIIANVYYIVYILSFPI